MPSVLHETLVELFTRRPLLAAELLVAAGVLPPGSVTDAVLVPGDVAQTPPPALQVDRAIQLLGGPRRVAVVEVQLRIDPDKVWTWPMHLCGVRAQTRSEVFLVVLTLDPVTAEWAAQPIVLGPHSQIQPVVIGPAQIPHITDPALAVACPELSMLSVWAHGRGPQGLALGRAAASTLTTLDAAHALVYFDLILQAVHPLARQALEKDMIENWQPESDFLKRLLAQGRVEGRVEGQTRALQSALQHQRSLLRRQLLRRFGELPLALDARIEQASQDQLDQWAEVLVTADSVHAVFA